MAKSPVILALLLSALAIPALAQEPEAPIAPRRGVIVPPVSAADLRVPERHLDDRDVVTLRRSCASPGRPDETRTTGDVHLSAGSDGYRAAGASVCIPIGGKGDVTLGADHERSRGRLEPLDLSLPRDARSRAP